MPDSIGGLPAHPLLVHAPIVLVPLAALGVLLMALRPRWLRTFGVPVAVLAGAGLVGTLLAARTGGDLESDLAASGQTISETLEEHGEMGENAQLVVALFALAVVAWVLFAWWRRRVGDERAAAVVRAPHAVSIVLTVLAVVTAVLATVSVTTTGHSGARSVWEDTERASSEVQLVPDA